MDSKEIASELEKARTQLRNQYGSAEVSATIIMGVRLFVSVKINERTLNIERLIEVEDDIPLSEWVCREVK